MNIAAERLHNQGISQKRFDNAAEVVRWHGAMQGQEYHSVKWAIALRTGTYSDKALDKLYDEGAFVRTHVMRPTWHLVAPEDIRWLLKLTAPRVHTVNGSMYRKFEVDELLPKVYDIFTKELEGNREKTRPELAKAVTDAGITIDKDNLRMTLFVMHAELEGLLINGARRGKQFTYALMEERVPKAKERDMDEALLELTLRYFRSHAPASVYDFSWWSGLTIAEVKKALSMQSEFVEVDGLWRAVNPESPAELPIALLLPAYDEYGIAYKDHGSSLASEFTEQATISVFGGTIVLEGQVVGYWRRTIEKKRINIELMPFRTLSSAELESIAAPAEAYSKFHELPVELIV